MQGAQHILGPFDCELRRWGLKLAERGGKRGKKRAIIATARKLAVLLHHLWVSEKSTNRAQQSPNNSGGCGVRQNGKTKSKSFQEEESQKAKAEFRWRDRLWLCPLRDARDGTNEHEIEKQPVTEFHLDLSLNNLS